MIARELTGEQALCVCVRLPSLALRVNLFVVNAGASDHLLLQVLPSKRRVVLLRSLLFVLGLTLASLRLTCLISPTLLLFLVSAYQQTMMLGGLRGRLSALLQRQWQQLVVKVCDAQGTLRRA